MLLESLNIPLTFDLNGLFYEYEWSDFLGPFTNGFFDPNKYMTAPKSTQYSVEKDIWSNLSFL